MFDQQATHQFLSALTHVECGEIFVTTPDHKSYAFKGDKPGATAHIALHDWRVINKVLRQGDIGLAEAYRDGWWDSPDTTELFLFGLQNERALENYIYGSFLGKVAARISYMFKRNTLNGSKKNIHAHYDLGNDFYALWLDPSMTYSSALFSNENEPLSQAQDRKYDRIIDRLNPSGSLLEIGCGWGGFAKRALEKGDYGIKGLTISKAQHDFARQRVGQRANIALEDYRSQNGLYDQIVSIEMFEAVGEKFWPTYFGKMKSLLADKGKAVVQTITISENYFERYKNSGDAIRTFIFPGGMLPSHERFKAASADAGLKVTDSFAFGQDYARTLQHWLVHFNHKIDDVKNMGFDDQFIRLWRSYLTTCIAAFKHGRIDVMQLELQHAA